MDIIFDKTESKREKIFSILSFVISIGSLIIAVLAICIPKIFDYTMAILLILISILLIIKTRKNIVLFICFMIIAFFNFSIMMGEYLAVWNRLSFTGLQNDAVVMSKSLAIMLIFMAVLLLFVKKPKIKLESFYVDNLPIFIVLCCIVSVISIMSCFINSGMIDKLFEYMIIVFVFLCFFTGNKKYRKLVVLFIYLFYVLISIYTVYKFSSGTNRVGMLQITTVLILFLYNNKLSFKSILCIGGIGIAIFTCLATIRDGNINFDNTLEYVIKNFFLNDTARFAYSASTTIVGYTEYFATYSERITSLFHFILAQFIGSGNSLTSLSNVVVITLSKYPHYGGTLFPFDFYFWFGWIGVIIAGLSLSSIINFAISKKGNYYYILNIIIVATVFRWYLYNPTALFRMCIILTSFGYIVLKKLGYISADRRLRKV